MAFSRLLGGSFASFTKSAPKSPFLCANKSHSFWCGSRAGARAIQNRVDKALMTLNKIASGWTLSHRKFKNCFFKVLPSAFFTKISGYLMSIGVIMHLFWWCKHLGRACYQNQWNFIADQCGKERNTFYLRLVQRPNCISWHVLCYNWHNNVKCSISFTFKSRLRKMFPNCSCLVLRPGVH